VAAANLADCKLIVSSEWHEHGHQQTQNWKQNLLTISRKHRRNEVLHRPEYDAATIEQQQCDMSTAGMTNVSK